MKPLTETPAKPLWRKCLDVLLIFLAFFLLQYAMVLLYFYSHTDFFGIATLTNIPVPEDAQENELAPGSIDSPGAFRRFVVYRNFTAMQTYYAAELTQRGWEIESRAHTFPAGVAICIKAHKPPLWNATIEILGGPYEERTVVLITPPTRRSIC